MKRYATVDELIIILQILQEKGLGDAEVWCNGEYGLSNRTYEECIISVHADNQQDKWISFD